jgi:DNA mismatch repair protein MutS
MKALGISIIMAQAGMFVPAKSFIYSPYKSIMTRISGNDNLFKELSSFGVEMVELKAIWNRADLKTLVIGDEICRGTEHVSGNAIVATTILKLASVNATFIFATHLHDIIKLQRIKQLTTVKAFHITVEHDHVTDELIFDRQLKEGSGPEVYGITVAKYLIQNNEFIQTANEIKDELLGFKDQLQQTATSKYNNNVFVHECHVCHAKLKFVEGVSTLDTHHINHQKDCVDGFVLNKEHLKKNASANLVVLCKSCHSKVHNGSLQIEGYVLTSNGKKLVTSHVDDEKKIIVEKKEKKKKT